MYKFVYTNLYNIQIQLYEFVLIYDWQTKQKT